MSDNCKYNLISVSKKEDLFYKTNNNKLNIDNVIKKVQLLVDIYKCIKKEIANFNENIIKLDKFIDQTQNGLMNSHSFKQKYLELVSQLLNNIRVMASKRIDGEKAINIRVYNNKSSLNEFIQDDKPIIALDDEYAEAKELNLITSENGQSNTQLLTLIPGLTFAVDENGNNLRFLATGKQFLSSDLVLNHTVTQNELTLESISNITYDFKNEFINLDPVGFSFKNGNVNAITGIKDASFDENESNNYDDATLDYQMTIARQVVQSHKSWNKNGNNFCNKVYKLISFFDRLERRMVTLNNFLVTSYSKKI